MARVPSRNMISVWVRVKSSTERPCPAAMPGIRGSKLKNAFMSALVVPASSGLPPSRPAARADGQSSGGRRAAHGVERRGRAARAGHLLGQRW